MERFELDGRFYVKGEPIPDYSKFLVDDIFIQSNQHGVCDIYAQPFSGAWGTHHNAFYAIPIPPNPAGYSIVDFREPDTFKELWCGDGINCGRKRFILKKLEESKPQERRCPGCGIEQISRGGLWMLKSSPAHQDSCPWYACFIQNSDVDVIHKQNYADAHWREYWLPKQYALVADIRHTKPRILRVLNTVNDDLLVEVLPIDGKTFLCAKQYLRPAYPDEIPQSKPLHLTAADVGKAFITREGKKCTVNSIGDWDAYQVKGYYEFNQHYWMLNGNFMANGKENPMDLIRSWTDADEADEAALQEKNKPERASDVTQHQKKDSGDAAVTREASTQTPPVSGASIPKDDIEQRLRNFFTQPLPKPIQVAHHERKQQEALTVWCQQSELKIGNKADQAQRRDEISKAHIRKIEEQHERAELARLQKKYGK